MAEKDGSELLQHGVADPESLPLTAEQGEEIERRLADHMRDPSAAIPWEEARERLRARFG